MLPNNLHTIIIGIAGGSGSGKTTLANQLLAALPKGDAAVISQDSYYRHTDHLSPEERAKINFDHPDAIDFDLLAAHLQDLKSGRSIQQPIYSFNLHNRIEKTKIISPKKVILTEGILILASEKIRTLCDVKIYVQASEDERQIRRLQRDTKERGRDVQEVMQRYQNHLIPMHLQYVEPSSAHADIIIPTHKNNRVAIDILKNYLLQIIS